MNSTSGTTKQMSNPVLEIPKESGYYWAKVRMIIPSGEDSEEFEISHEWEIVEVRWSDNWGLTPYGSSIKTFSGSKDIEVTEWGDAVTRIEQAKSQKGG